MHPLDTTIAPRHLLKHPFYQRWMEGALTRSELQTYVKNYFPHVMAFPTYISAVHAQADNLALRQALLENLIEEERGEEHHPELWLRFGEALGLSRSEIEQADTLPAAKHLVETFRGLCQRSVASGLGALYAYESQVPAIAEQKIEGLKKHFDVTSDRGLAFFKVHLQADELHAQTGKDAIDALDSTANAEALHAAQVASEALWDFLSALDAASLGANAQDTTVCAAPN